MASLQHRVYTTVSLGGEQVRIDVDRTFSVTEKYDITREILNSASEGSLTLWSNAEHVDEPTFLAIIVDPEKKLSSAVVVTVELTIDAVAVSLEVSSNVPLMLGDPDGGADIATIDGKITQVRVRNEDTTNDIDVRVLACK